MKIAVITFHRAVNYGAVLQAYALCSVIRDLGNACDIIDYRCRFIEDYYDGKKLFRPRNWKRLVSYILANGNLNPKKERFSDFLNRKHMLSDQKYGTKEELFRINAFYDLFITGSDQVWNYAAAGFDAAFFLDFVEKDSKKRSYAASFGFSALPEEYIGQYKKLLKGFSRISVRESAGKNILKQLTDVPVTVDLDPTLLVDVKGWKEAAKTDRDEIRSIIRHPYILVYMIGEENALLAYAKKKAREEQVNVVYITDRWRNKAGVINLRNVKPEEWVLLFQNASFIVTNSFHGLAFSINFNKQFLLYTNQTGKKRESRMTTLLNDLDIKNRCVDKAGDIGNRTDELIDYERVNVLLEQRRKESIQNLKKSIGMELEG